MISKHVCSINLTKEGPVPSIYFGLLIEEKYRLKLYVTKHFDVKS